MKETWATIPGLEYYEASTFGRIRSVERTIVQANGKIRTFPSKLLKHFIDDCGYPRICLYKNRSIGTKYKVHRLVALAFIHNPDNKPVVNHIDSDRTNAHVENLEWCTVSENVQHSIRSGMNTNVGKYGDLHHASKPVIAIKIESGERIRFGSQKDAARKLGIFQTHVNGCITGRCKSTKGYKFISA